MREIAKINVNEESANCAPSFEEADTLTFYDDAIAAATTRDCAHL